MCNGQSYSKSHMTENISVKRYIIGFFFEKKYCIQIKVRVAVQKRSQLRPFNLFTSLALFKAVKVIFLKSNKSQGQSVINVLRVKYYCFNER